MGQSAQRTKSYDKALESFGLWGGALLAQAPEPVESTAWLQRNFLPGLMEAAKGGSHAWHNQAYLAALSHCDAKVRQGVQELMNNVFAAGLEPGRIVFSLLVAAQLPAPMVIGEFEDTEPLATWVSSQLRVSRHNLRLRHTAMFAPAHGGLFFVLPALQALTRDKAPGVMPFVKTRPPSTNTKAHQTLMFLVSVRTDTVLDLSSLQQGAAAPKIELGFWGPQSESADHRATVTPIRAEHAFESLQMLGGFRESLASADEGLAPWRAEAIERSKDGLPTLDVVLHRGSDFRFQNGLDVAVKFSGIDMPSVLAYSGSFAEFFVPHLEKLEVRLNRIKHSQDLPASSKAISS